MDIQAKVEELTQQQQMLLMNTQRLAGAIAILNEQLSEECTHTLHSDDSGCTCHKCTCVLATQEEQE
jgi:hypothetical protein